MAQAVKVVDVELSQPLTDIAGLGAYRTIQSARYTARLCTTASP